MIKIELYTIMMFALANMAYAAGDLPTVETNAVEINTLETNQTVEVTEQISTLNTTTFKVGTLGAGIDLSIPMTETLNLRLSLNGLSYSVDDVEEDINYEGTAQLLTIGALLDYYPVEDSTFRLSGGVYYNGNKTEADAYPTGGDYEINDVTYQADEIGSLSGLVDFDTVSPYVGLGWGGRSVEPGWGFSLDIGAMYHGEPNVSAEVTRGAGIPNDAAGDAFYAQLEADVEAERLTIEEDASDFTIYPVIMIGVTYTF